MRSEAIRHSQVVRNLPFIVLRLHHILVFINTRSQQLGVKNFFHFAADLLEVALLWSASFGELFHEGDLFHLFWGHQDGLLVLSGDGFGADGGHLGFVLE